MEVKPVEINIDSAFVPIDQAFNRVKYFSTIADKLQSQHLHIESWDIQIGMMTHQILVPSNEDLKNIYYGFDKWTGRHLLSDMLEAFYTMLDNIFWFCLILEHVNEGKIHSSQHIDINKYKEFCKNSVDEKIRVLKEKGLCVDKANQGKVFAGLKDIRNCLTHAQGRVLSDVGQEGKSGKRKIYWLAFHLFILTESNKRRKLELGKLMKEAGHVCLEIRKHEKEFSIGEEILFSREELFEIAWTIQNLALDMKTQLIEVFKSKGILHSQLPNVNPLENINSNVSA